MIGVLADDFSGAAEIAGVALRHGFSVELFADLPYGDSADIVVIDSNSRSLSRESAVASVAAKLDQLEKLQPAWMYKKTDSVLRGHVMAELDVMMQSLQKNLVLLVPANPDIGRIISNGKIYINGKLLHHTVFRHDPEYPVHYSEALRLLNCADIDVKKVLKRVGENLPAKGIVIGETLNSDELNHWADCWNESILPAGGSEFFGGLLNRQGYPRSDTLFPRDLFRDKTILNLWGTRVQSPEKIHQFRQAGFHFFEMPVPDYDSDQAKSSQQASIAHIARLCCNKKRLVLRPLARDFTLYGAAILHGLLQRVQIDELIIEGGTTASSMVRALNWNGFRPVQEIAPGIVRLDVMQQPGLNLTVKPGSYAWPDSVWQAL